MATFTALKDILSDNRYIKIMCYVICYVMLPEPDLFLFSIGGEKYEHIYYTVNF